MGDAPLSTLIAVMSALLGALVVLLVGLRVVVKRATEQWARDHWEEHTREILEVEHVAQEVAREDSIRAAAEGSDDTGDTVERAAADAPTAEDSAKKAPPPPDEDPATRRRRERRERAQRIRERIRQRRIAERVMGDGPAEKAATYGGRPASIDPGAGQGPPPGIRPRRASRAAAAWGAAPQPAPSAPAPAAATVSKGVGIAGTGPVPPAAAAMADAGPPAGPQPVPEAASPTPAAPPPQAMPPRPSAGGGARKPAPAPTSEVQGPASAPSSPSPPKPPKRNRRGGKKPGKHKPPPDISTLDAALIDKIKALAAEGRVILANKAYREATQTSFRDAETEVKKILALGD